MDTDPPDTSFKRRGALFSRAATPLMMEPSGACNSMILDARHILHCNAKAILVIVASEECELLLQEVSDLLAAAHVLLLTFGLFASFQEAVVHDGLLYRCLECLTDLGFGDYSGSFFPSPEKWHFP